MKSLDWGDYHNLVTHAAVGTLTLVWSKVEAALEEIIWQYLGSPDRGHVVTSQLHNMARCDLLRELSAMVEPSDDIKARIEDGLAAFDVLRLNRNVIVHCIDLRPHAHEENVLIIERRKKSLRMEAPDVYLLDRNKLAEMIHQMMNLDDFFRTLLLCMQRRAGAIRQPFFDWQKPPPLPDRFPLPERLSKLPD